MTIWDYINSQMRFTDRTRKVLKLAVEEAKRNKKGYVGTEHLLLAVLLEGGGVAALVLKERGVDVTVVRNKIAEVVGHCGADGIATLLQSLPCTESAIQRSLEEASRLGCDYIGTEHIVLSLLRDQEAVGGQILSRLGLDYEQTRDELWSYFEHCWRIDPLPP